MIRLNRRRGSDIKDLLEKTDDKSSFSSARRMFSKFKVATPPNAYHYQVEVCEAEIRKLRCENELLKVQVVQLNEVLVHASCNYSKRKKRHSDRRKKSFSRWLSRRETLKNARLGRWYSSQFKDSRSLSQLRYVHFRLSCEWFTFSHYSYVLS